VIDLHLHTTASDGRLSPTALVARAAEAGVTRMAVTDHDTTAGLDEARAQAAIAGIEVVTGIELTSVHMGRDVHILGYFFDPADARLARLLETQRTLRVARLREIGARLARAGVPIDVERVMDGGAGHPGRSVGRPLLARELVARGHVASVQEAFDRYLGSGCPAFVPREGRGPAEFVRAVHDAGGVASFAHPGVTKQDALIEPLVAEGLDAIEVYHSDHTPEMRETFLHLARRLEVCVTGGSDFHGDGERRNTLGLVSLPAEDFVSLAARAADRRGEPRLHTGSGGHEA
jgi:predicted metal-dependent phosphoesterase TrpH